MGRAGLSTETITVDGYGVIMAVVTAVAIPIAGGSIYLIAKDTREAKNVGDADAAVAARDSKRLEKIKLAIRAVTELESIKLRQTALALLAAAVEEACPADRTLGALALIRQPETVEQDSAVGVRHRAAPVRPIPARTTPQLQQEVRRSTTPHSATHSLYVGVCCHPVP